MRLALERGHAVTASTRQPGAFPLQHARLRVAGGDATDPGVARDALEDCDAVISVIGSAYTRRPVTVYSRAASAVVGAMRESGCRRLLAVTSSGVTPLAQRDDLSVPGRAFHRLARRTFGRTVYDDMERMEAVVSDSPVDWTIVRPPGLTDEPGTGYAIAEDVVEGPYCSRDDLAAVLLDQLDDDRYRRRVAAVSTPGLHVGALTTFRREMLKR
ncbi:Putative NADH-flavin reductase [Microlunatus sagamiharensis]|uniref:Putative NADH-flavin reductase n=1 Tax=Microlunatus sagamiharensis TaxID=546874 RepID=A0A1H2MLY3_9ACTN|nr:Putative NADH-flavin reductase [Microlunatus sagamiharensis]